MAKVMISLPQEFLKKVDRTARALGRSRSELIREALRAMLTGKQSGPRSWKEALAPLRKLKTQWVGRWDSTEIIRDHRETRARLRAKRLAEASQKVRKESMRVNTEFAAIERGPDA